MKLFLPALVVLVSLLTVPATAQDFDKGMTAYNRGDYATALREWRPLAEQGHVLAQFALGVMYKTGQDFPQNHVEAAIWFRKAAEQGHVQAQFSLGAIFAFGEGVPKDEVEAIRWYRLAAEQGLAGAQYALGVSYFGGSGVPQDNINAVKWYPGLKKGQTEFV